MRKSCCIACSLASGIVWLISGGCTHKELNEDAHTTIADNVEVVFDWSKAPDKNASTMVLYLYSDIHDMMEYRFNNPYGGMIRTYAGSHTTVCHSNDDPYGHHIRNQHSHDEIEIFTDDTSVLVGQGISTQRIPRAPGTEDEPLRVTPQMIYGIHDRNVDLKVSGLLQKLTLYPEELVCHYTVEFLEVENLQTADLRIDATISSLAGGFYPGKMSSTAEAVSHVFTLSADLEKRSLKSEFLTFGIPDRQELPHSISLYIIQKNRQGSFYTFDVSDQVNFAPDPHDVRIKIYGLKLPDNPYEPPTLPDGEQGFTIDVDTWDTIHYDLPV